MIQTLMLFEKGVELISHTKYMDKELINYVQDTVDPYLQNSSQQRDQAKAKSNLKKHGVSFEEAQSVFYDDLALQFYDGDSSDEDRSLLLGMSNESRILIVVHCERKDNREELRIISARKATNNEQQYYQGGSS